MCHVIYLLIHIVSTNLTDWETNVMYKPGISMLCINPEYRCYI